MYNVKAAVSRLEFAPKPKKMEVTDIATGHFVFSPSSGEAVSYLALDRAITGAGYEIEGAVIEVLGTWIDDHHFRVEETGQTFQVLGQEGLEEPRGREGPGDEARLRGRWLATSEGEVIDLREGADPDDH